MAVNELEEALQRDLDSIKSNLHGIEGSIKELNQGKVGGRITFQTIRELTNPRGTKSSFTFAVLLLSVVPTILVLLVVGGSISMNQMIQISESSINGMLALVAILLAVAIFLRQTFRGDSLSDELNSVNMQLIDLKSSVLGLLVDLADRCTSNKQLQSLADSSIDNIKVIATSFSKITPNLVAKADNWQEEIVRLREADYWIHDTLLAFQIFFDEVLSSDVDSQWVMNRINAVIKLKRRCYEFELRSSVIRGRYAMLTKIRLAIISAVITGVIASGYLLAPDSIIGFNILFAPLFFYTMTLSIIVTSLLVYSLTAPD